MINQLTIHTLKIDFNII